MADGDRPQKKVRSDRLRGRRPRHSLPLTKQPDPFCGPPLYRLKDLLGDGGANPLFRLGAETFLRAAAPAWADISAIGPRENIRVRLPQAEAFHISGADARVL